MIAAKRPELGNGATASHLCDWQPVSDTCNCNSVTRPWNCNPLQQRFSTVVGGYPVVLWALNPILTLFQLFLKHQNSVQQTDPLTQPADVKPDLENLLQTENEFITDRAQGWLLAPARIVGCFRDSRTTDSLATALKTTLHKGGVPSPLGRESLHRMEGELDWENIDLRRRKTSHFVHFLSLDEKSKVFILAQ